MKVVKEVSERVVKEVSERISKKIKARCKCGEYVLRSLDSYYILVCLFNLIFNCHEERKEKGDR